MPTLAPSAASASARLTAEQNFLGTNVYDSVEFGLFTNSAAYSVISGGSANRNIGRFSVIGGGSLNRIGTSQFPVNYATIAGGSANFASGDSASVGGGSNNAANGSFSTIPGGRDNRAGPQSFAAGTRAKADQAGSFVWADDTEADFASTTNKQFAVRANNGVMIQAANTALDLRGGGGVRVEGAGVNSSTPVFIHRVTATSVSGNITIIDHPHCNGNPGAILIITHNYSADIAANKYATEPVGVWYNSTRWTIFHENNLVPMPVGRAFNVMVIKP